MINKSSKLIARLVLILTLVFTMFASQASIPIQAAPLVQEGVPESPGEPLSIAAPGDHLLTNITFNVDTPNIARTNQHIDLTFEYITNQAGGVRIFVLPYTNGSPSPNFGVSPSGIYATGSGKGSAFFTITSGEVVVDEVRLRIVDVNQTTVLFEEFLPVYYLFTDSAHVAFNLSLAPDTPDMLNLNQNVDFDFEYITREQNGVRIFMRPFTNGSLTPSYAAHSSPLYAAGAGGGAGYFTVTSGAAVVDQIRVQMTNADQSVLLFEAFLPVYYRYRQTSNIVTHIELIPDTPNIFKYGENVNFSFNYSSNHAGDVLIFIRPFSGANLSPNYAAHPSDIYPAGSGSGTGFFTLNAGPGIVDRVRVQMWDAAKTTLLFEAFLPVHLLWAGAGPPPGPDMQIDAIEVTQAIQDLNNSVDLVAGKRTYVRVHTSTPVNVTDVFASLSGRRGFWFLYPILTPGNPGGDITVRTSPDRGQINDSFWFELPSSWTTSGNLTLTARLDPNGAKFDPNPSNNIKSITVNFKATPPLRLRIVNVQYTRYGNTYLAANSHLNALESWLRRAYPINSLQVSRQTFVYPTNGLPNVDTLHGYLAFAKILRILFNGEDGRVVYYGMVDDGGGFMRGKALDIPSTIAAGPTGTDTWGWDTDGSYGDWYGGHEIAHTRNRYHAEYCGAGGGVPYPYTGGRISPDLSGNGAIYGFDITTRAIYEPNWEDVMTYCDKQWVSDFTYEGIRSYLVGVGQAVESLQSVTASEFLALMGFADLSTNTATLEDVYQITQEATVPLPEPGDWSIALVDAGDNDLATYPFQPNQLTDAEESPGIPAVIAEVVPWSAGTVRVEIRYQGNLVASRNASQNAPGVTILSPTGGSSLPEGPFQVSWQGTDPDGDPLTYSLLYSNDGGSTWESLASGLSAEQIELDTAQLPGGDGVLRVLVSDGLLSGQDTSEVFSVPLHAPVVSISMPEPDQVFFPTQQVTLQGSAYDLEDGTPDDSAFEWASSIDGVLGTGPSFSTAELTTGSHTITLTVTDSDGMSSEASRQITISEEDAPEVNILEANPSVIYLVSEFQGPSQHITDTLRSSGDTEMDWSASEDILWLTLDQTSGKTPSELDMTVNPSGLSVGLHSGIITFNSPQSTGAPLELLITLQVNGNAVFLPSVFDSSAP